MRGPEGPLANALVLVSDEQAEISRSPVTARTGATGQFRLTLPPSPAFLVRVESPGLAARAIRHVRPGAPLSITLARGASITGVVREIGGGTPVSEATVEAREESRTVLASAREPDSGVVRTTTDAKGRFRLDGLAAGLHSLTAFARGVGRGEKRGAPTGRPVEIGLVPGGAVTGTVTTGKGKAVEGAVVRVIPSLMSGSRARLLARTDAQGAFAIHGATPGTYRVVVTHPDLAPGILESVVVERDSEARADVVLPAVALVRGRLVGTGDKPTRGSVVLRQMAGEPVPEGIDESELMAEASDDGVFTLRAGPGSHVVEARAPGLATRRIDVDVPAGSETVDLGEVALEAGIAIRGRVRDSAGHPVERATLFTYSDETERSYEARSEADGSYTLAGLPLGLFSVYASATGFGRAERKAEAGATGIDFVLAPGGTIVGAVVDEAGRPVEAFRVSARPPVIMGRMSGGRAESFGAPDGRFVLEDVAEGEYVVDVTAPDRAPAVVSGVKVAAGGSGDAGTVRLTAGGIIKGVVVDASSAPVSGASVYVSGPGRDYSRSVPEVTTDSGGTFEVRGLPPGTAQVRAIHSAYTPGLAGGIEVDPARGPADVRIVLTQGGRVEGRVRSRDGSLPAGAAVTARSMRPGTAWYTPTGPNMQPVAADGTFFLEHVPAGPVSVTLLTGRPGQYQGGQEVRAEVREGETTAVEIVLRSIAVSGKVTRGGSPLSGARVEFHGPNMMRMFSGGGGLPPTLPPNAGITREDGSYDLSVSSAGQAYVEIQTPDRQARLPTPPVEVPDADTYVADFNFSGAFIEGIVIDKDTEQPIPAAAVGAALGDGSSPRNRYSSADSNIEGRFRLEVDPGEYRVTARADGYGSESLTVTVGESGATGVRLALDRGLAIKGRVVDAAGRGVGGLMVGGFTGDEKTGSGGFGRTLSDGSFEMAGLLETPYTVSTSAEGGLFAVAPGIVPGARPATLTLQPGGRVQVKVLGADGAPAASSTVVVSRVQGSVVRWGLGVGQTDAGGMAELVVPAGTIELTARASDLEAKTTVTVPSGGTTTVELVLQPRPKQ